MKFFFNSLAATSEVKFNTILLVSSRNLYLKVKLRKSDIDCTCSYKLLKRDVSFLVDRSVKPS